MQLTEEQQKQGWRIVKFGDIAKNVSKRVDPGDTGLEVYVGLEHLDPDNLRITRRGIPGDVKGQKLLVKSGQIIFGKRRAYQRKVAVADFEGICSAHAMVLEAIHKAVIPEYLPFFMQSDIFMERAKAISEGSLSPTIKWKTLANQKFPLPPRVQQEEMVEVFSAFERINTKYDDSYKKAHQSLELIIREKLFNENSTDEFVELSEFLEEVRDHYIVEVNTTDHIYVGYEHINSESIRIAENGTSKDVRSNKLYFKKNDILYGKIRPYLKKTALAEFDGICSIDIIVLRPKNEKYSEPLSLALKTDYFAKLAMSTVSGSKMPRASWKMLSKVKINKSNLLGICLSKTLEALVKSISQLQLSKNKILEIQTKVTAGFMKGQA